MNEATQTFPIPAAPSAPDRWRAGITISFWLLVLITLVAALLAGHGFHRRLYSRAFGVVFGSYRARFIRARRAALRARRGPVGGVAARDQRLSHPLCAGGPELRAGRVYCYAGHLAARPKFAGACFRPLGSLYRSLCAGGV